MLKESGESPETGLDDRDELIMHCLMAGMTHADAAAFLNIATKTIHRRVQEADFRREHALRWSLVLSQATDGVSALVVRATETLSFLLESDSPPVAAKAIDLTFKWASVFLKQTHQDARISRIEGFLRLEADLDLDELQ